MMSECNSVNGDGVLGGGISGMGMEVAAEWRKLRRPEFLDLHCSHDAVMVKGSREIRQAGKKLRAD